MRYSEASLGRIFILRLEDGDMLNDTIEIFAHERGIHRGLAFFLGGAAEESQMVVGPGTGPQATVVPLVHALTGAHEILAVGTLFPNEAGRPILHMHAACGREGDAVVGCTRTGVKTWLVGEVVLLEIGGSEAVRRRDPATGFELLELP